MAATYERLLRRAGHRVVMASSRAEGLPLLENVRPKLVISDLRLPDGSGLEIIRAARRLEPPPPVIAITAFLAKPFGIAEFSSLVEDLMKHRLH